MAVIVRTRSSMSLDGENAWLSKAELEAALKELGFNDLPIGRMFELFDQNGDGKISYEEMDKREVEIDGIYKQRRIRKK